MHLLYKCGLGRANQKESYFHRLSGTVCFIAKILGRDQSRLSVLSGNWVVNFFLKNEENKNRLKDITVTAPTSGI